jgi:hypothetical protein
MNDHDRFDRWYGMDTENDEHGNVVLVCLISESGESTIWKGRGGFSEWCRKQRKHRPVVICHNLEYDLVNEFGSEYPNLALNYLKGRLISAKLGCVTFWDSFNHFRMSLKELGKSVGIEKREMDIYDEAYVTTDAWISLTAMTRARDYIGSIGGSIGPTAGSSAVSVWRTMTDDAYVYGAVDSEWFRKGYYGGRTEIFRREADGIVSGYDVNSMYPYCMLNEFPEYLVDDMGFVREKGIIEATVSVPTDEFVAPLVHRGRDGRLTFPVGCFRGVWTYDEVRFAMERGAKLIKVHTAVGCDSLVRPFDFYIHTLYDKRKRSTDPAERLFLKVMMNSLYGKLATKSTITRTVSRHTMLTKNSSRIDDVVWINKDRGLLEFKTPPADYVNVPWGAMITAYSRLELTRRMHAVNPEKLVYCDTDSIYVEDTEMETSSELGGLKLESSERGMKVLQKKLYRHGDKYVAKGVPRKRTSKEGIVTDHAMEFFENGSTTFMAPIRFRQSMMMADAVPNRWVSWKKSVRTEFNEKPLLDGRYFPPTIGLEGEFAFTEQSTTGRRKERKT